jgi:hypothetical protein
MTSGAECKNCGEPLAGRYCSACGQAADVRIPSFGGLVVDALGDVFNFDSRVWRSLATLVRPGRLTARFLEGQRAKYTPPFRLYIVTSLVFFAVFSLGRGGASVTESRPVIAPPADVSDASSPQTTVAQSFGIDIDETGGWSCNLDNQNMSPAVRARLQAACKKMEADNGASYLRAFADHIPVMMLVIIPLVAALMKLLYLFSKRGYVEHLLFFVHVHTFFFLAGTVAILLSLSARLVPFLASPVRIAVVAVWIYFPVYVYLAMRHVYRQGHLVTTIKYVMLGSGYFFATLVTLLGLIIYTAVTL